MSSLSRTLSLFETSSSNSSNPESTLHSQNSSPPNTSATFTINRPVQNKPVPPRKSSSDKSFTVKFSEKGYTLAKTQTEKNFRGIPWRFEFFHKNGNIGVRIYCKKGNKSGLWKCSAVLCWIVWKVDGVEQTSVVINDVDVTYEAGKQFHDFPCIWKYEDVLIELELSIDIKSVSGIRMDDVIDFTKPRDNVFDGVFVIGGRRVYAGKAFLALYSPYFHSLFFAPFVERNLAEITLEDVDYDEFVAFLTYIYPNEKPVTKQNVDFLLKYSDRFDVPTLMEKCENWLISDKEIDPAYKLLIAERYRLADLQNHVLQGFKTQAEVQKLSKSEHYGDLSDASKTSILDRMIEMLDDKDSDSSDDVHMEKARSFEDLEHLEDLDVLNNPFDEESDRFSSETESNDEYGVFMESDDEHEDIIVID